MSVAGRIKKAGIQLAKLFVLQAFVIFVTVGFLDGTVGVAFEKSIPFGTNIAKRLGWDSFCISRSIVCVTMSNG